MDSLHKKRFPHGILTALVTPFDSCGAIDYSSLKLLLRRQITQGAGGVVLLGTTGEAPTVSQTERARLLGFSREVCGGDMFLIAGCGSYDTAFTVKQAKAACQAGMDGLLVVTPYYNKPSQNGLLRHYLSVAEETELPVMMYNVPSRTGVNLSLDTARVLFAHENISALKEAGGDISDITEKLIQLSGCDIFCGNDTMMTHFLTLGGAGCVSVASNIILPQLHRVLDAYALGRAARAAQSFAELYPFLLLLSCETNPAPVKAAMAQLGLIPPYLRLPMTQISEANLQKITDALQDFEIS